MFNLAAVDSCIQIKSLDQILTCSVEDLYTFHLSHNL